MRRALVGVLVLFVVVGGMALARQTPSTMSASAGHLSDPFALGWMLADTSGDGIPDVITGKIVVSNSPTAAENAAAANLAARVGYGSTGLTLPVVVTASQAPSQGVQIWIGTGAMPQSASSELASLAGPMGAGEGGVFEVGGGLAVVGDDTGLTAAAASYAARAPYQWKVPGNKLADIAAAVDAAGHGSGAQLAGVTYQQGEPGIQRAIVRASFAVSAADLAGAFASGHLAAVHDLVLVGAASVTASNPKPMAGAGPEAAGAEGGAGGGEANPLDLATLYTSKGLFTGAARMPIPSASNAHLYVPAGAAGVAMANLAVRMGLETTGITLPIASPADEANARQIPTQAVVVGGLTLGKAAEETLRSQDKAADQAEPTLGPGEGELRVVDNSSGRNGAVLVRGDEAGSAAALDLLSGHFPNVWETGKKYQSLEEIRYELHHFFSLRSGVGQASAAEYTLDQWMKEIKQAGGTVSNVKAEVYVDLADAGLQSFVQKQVEQGLGVSNVEATAASLHAGLQCCSENPPLHYHGPDYEYHATKPTFSEDVVVPWEGTRLLKAVQGSASKMKAGQSIKVLARVSEGPEERQKLATQIEQILTKAGAEKSLMHVEVLCAYKPGFSWLMDEIEPALEGKGVTTLQIDFAKDVDPSNMRSMFNPARWVQELFPVDELLAKKLNIPIDKVKFNEIDSPPDGPTYRVHALDASGKEILTREFTVPTVMRAYDSVFPRFEQVKVDTGWVRIDVGPDKVLDQRIETDLETFWDHYQNITLPKIYNFVMSQVHGRLLVEFSPPFDTLKMDIHMSEPEYQLGLDKERISSLDAFEEDAFYGTENFVEMWGHIETGQNFNYTGRVIPVVHPPAADDGKDGHVHIEFYAKPAPNPLVRLSWTDAQGKHQERERNIPILNGELMPRLIQAQVKAGTDGVEKLTWMLPADYQKDDYNEWLKESGPDQLDRSMFTVEKAEGELHWLEQMHAAGLYGDEVAYPRVRNMAMEFELPRDMAAPVDSPAPREYMSWTIPVPAHPRPMINDYDGQVTHTPIVQWDEPISPPENAGILARFDKLPGANVYWMGRSYLGENIWAADIMEPSPSAMRSYAKETTLKAVIVYSGRQHANEVSSTSHIDKLGEQLLTDPAMRSYLKQVNVVLHPITNPDGAQLSVDLAKITPNNILHEGYHASLGADEASGEEQLDPIYPESRTRKQLIQAWNPDTFLNPHGYPDHEWVQQFSEYVGGVTNGRQTTGDRSYWIPRGWYTSMGYVRDPQHPYSEQITFAMRDLIVQGLRGAPGLLDLETRENARYAKYGQFAPTYMTTNMTDGIRIYMALKGGNSIGAGVGAGLYSPDITWDAGYTEAPDETAHGAYMALVAGAGLAFDKAHLTYLAQGKLRITRTERDVPGGVQWRVERARPILPPDVQRSLDSSSKKEGSAE